MKPHIKNVAARARAATHALAPVLKSRLPLRTKLGVYKTYVRPILTYAAPAWFALASETNKKILRAQQSLALRRLTNAPRYVRNSTLERDLRIEALDHFIIRLTRNMFARADASAHPHIRSIAPWHSRPPDRRAFPRDLLPSDLE
ncbi:jg5582 [Pararge aegeria aegeria]|uniref:Jg5582 protein n=1 Tax=Pararge aegeria aegeria TaxID=348720 RepID=A0A8S4QAE1_9NEOP|nr:jg5582 [Pararge aegeria aegeria]